MFLLTFLFCGLDSISFIWTYKLAVRISTTDLPIISDTPGPDISCPIHFSSFFLKCHVCHGHGWLQRCEPTGFTKLHDSVNDCTTSVIYDVKFRNLLRLQGFLFWDFCFRIRKNMAIKFGENVQSHWWFSKLPTSNKEPWESRMSKMQSCRLKAEKTAPVEIRYIWYLYNIYVICISYQ